MTVQARLLLTLGAIVVVMLLPAAYGVSQLDRLRDIAVELQGDHARASLAVGNLRASIADLDRFLRTYIALPAAEPPREAARALEEARQALERLGQSGYEPAAAPTMALMDSLAAATRRIEGLVEQGRAEEATAFFEGVKPLLDRAARSLDPLASAIDTRSREEVANAERVSAAAAQSTTIAALVAALLTLLVGGWASHALSTPLRRLSAGTAKVAAGEFVAPSGLPYNRDDEIGELSRSFRSMAERLAELDRLKAEFVSLASHELKTPINVIGGYSELLEDGLYGEMNEKQVEVLGLIQEQANTLTRLVNQLLDLSRFESGGFQLQMEPVALGELLRRVQASFDVLAAKKQIDFSVEADESLPGLIHGDPDRLQHEVLSNLLSNAFKFTPTGGRISVRAWAEDGRVSIVVEDTGAGIPAKDLPHIFEKYYQVGRDARSKGTGLGLAIVKQIIEAHDGTIRAESVVDEGTRFHITLPAGPPGAEDSA